MLASSSCTHRETRPSGPVIPHGAVGAAVPTGRGPPAPTTPAAAGHSRSSAPAGAADSSRDPQSRAAQTSRSGATRLASPAMDLPSITADLCARRGTDADYRALSCRRPPVLAEERRARITSVSPAGERGRSRQLCPRSGAIRVSWPCGCGHARQFHVRPPKHLIRGLDSLGSGLDELQHVIGVGDHRHVVRRDFDGGGAHAGGELALGIGRDGLIAVGDHEPGRV